MSFFSEFELDPVNPAHPVKIGVLSILSPMRHYEATVFHRPARTELQYLPEGPCDLGGGRFSWVAIQHGAMARTGSLNVADLETGHNSTFDLPGRPGFAFPTTNPREFLVGLERHLRIVNLDTGELTELCGPVDDEVTGTIINDA